MRIRHLKKNTPLLEFFLILFCFCFPFCFPLHGESSDLCLAPRTVLPLKESAESSSLSLQSLPSLRIQDFFTHIGRTRLKPFLFLAAILMTPGNAFGQVTEGSLLKAYLSYSNQVGIAKTTTQRDSARVKEKEAGLFPVLSLKSEQGMSLPLLPSPTGNGPTDQSQVKFNAGLGLRFPSLGGNLQTSAGRDQKGDLNFGLSYGQNILRDGPFVGLSAERFEEETAKADAQANPLVQKIKIMSELSELRLLFWQLYVYGELIRVSRENVPEFQKSLDFESKKLKLGQGMQDEVLRAQLKLVEFKGFISKLESVYLNLQLKISGLTGIPAGDVFAGKDLSADLGTAPGLAEFLKMLDLHPESQLNRVEIRKKQLEEERAANQSSHSLSIGPSAGMTLGEGTKTGNQAFVGVLLSFTPSFTSHQRTVAGLGTKIARLGEAETKRKMTTEVNALDASFREASRLLRQYQEEAKLARERYEIVANGYYVTGRYPTAKEALETLLESLGKQQRVIEQTYQIKSIQIRLDQVSGYLSARFPFLRSQDPLFAHAS